jgi:PIN domain nuclease of toxin-antitoxin system
MGFAGDERRNRGRLRHLVVSLLLDTHVVLWAMIGDPTLGTDLLDRLRHDPEVFVSPVTSWEITIRQAAGKLNGPPDLAERVRDAGFRQLPVTHAHAISAGRLPMHHRDPFDRMLIAQAIVEGLTLATRDHDIQRYDVAILAV